LRSAKGWTSLDLTLRTGAERKDTDDPESAPINFHPFLPFSKHLAAGQVAVVADVKQAVTCRLQQLYIDFLLSRDTNLGAAVAKALAVNGDYMQL
jgi:hypothetical protein